MHDALHRGRHHRLDRLVKTAAIGGGIVEPALGAEGVRLEIGESGIRGDPHPQIEQGVEDVRQLVPAPGIGARSCSRNARSRTPGRWLCR